MAACFPRLLKGKSRPLLWTVGASILLYLLFQTASQTTIRLRSYPKFEIDLNDNNSSLLLINGHAGTSLDFANIARLLNLSHTYTEVSPRLFTPYGQTAAEATNLGSTIGATICSHFSHVAVIDTIPDARFLFQLLLDDKCPSVEKVLMIATNRFDFDVIDYWDYYALIRKVGRKLEDRVIWVSNNPWESKFATLRLGGDYLKFTMIRPFGLSALPQSPRPADAHLPVIFNYDNVISFHKTLQSVGIPVKLLPKRYGGPTALRQYKALISIPYQASTMKMYENIAHGVTMLVPSPRFLAVLLSSPGYELSGAGGTYDAGFEGFKYIEFYNSDLSRFFYQFDSLEELRDILSRDIVDVRNVRENGPKYWEGVRSDGEIAWKAVFHRFLN